MQQIHDVDNGCAALLLNYFKYNMPLRNHSLVTSARQTVDPFEFAQI